MLITARDGSDRGLADVYFLPKLRSNIISLGQLDEHGCRILVENGYLQIYDKQQKLLMKIARGRNRLYTLNLRIGEPVCLLGSIMESTWLWHARYGLLNFDSVWSLAQYNMVEGLPPVKQEIRVCDGCLIWKQYRTPFPKQMLYRADACLELVYADLCGHITPPTPAGNRYFILFVDDKSQYM